ncbi:ABC transporter substrate-binding protein [Rhodococcus sp. NPDC056743]|uniref:ABC transporter substrate-binding protein n=1 Tax=Rhodococcus sp. NPDC056743 TaxID=3345934 RepID=UPI00366DA900
MKFSFDLLPSARRPHVSVAGVNSSRRDFMKFVGVGVAAVGAGTVLAGCSDTSSSGQTVAETGGVLASNALAEPTKFVVGSAAGDNFLIDVVNKEQGNFASYNLSVPDLLFPSSSVQANQLLASGALGGCMTDITLAINAFANSTPGQRPVVVGLRVPVNTYSVVVGKGSWPAESASFEDKMNALRGKRIGVTALGAGADQQLIMALEAAGIPERDVTRIGVGQISPAIAQMSAGRLDGYVGYSRGASLAVAHQAKGSLLANFADPGTPETLRNQVVGAVVVREDFARSNPEVVKAWLAAQEEGQSWIEANPEAAAALLNKNSFDGKMQEPANQSIRFFRETVFPSAKPMFQVPRDSIELMVGLAEKQGLIAPGTVHYEDLVPDYARAQ